MLMAVVLPGRLQGWGLYIAFFLVIFVASDLLDMILVARFRQRVVGYIREHAQEIQSVA